MALRDLTSGACAGGSGSGAAAGGLSALATRVLERRGSLGFGASGGVQQHEQDARVNVETQSSEEAHLYALAQGAPPRALEQTHNVARPTLTLRRANNAPPPPPAQLHAVPGVLDAPHAWNAVYEQLQQLGELDAIVQQTHTSPPPSSLADVHELQRARADHERVTEQGVRATPIESHVSSTHAFPYGRVVHAYRAPVAIAADARVAAANFSDATTTSRELLLQALSEGERLRSAGHIAQARARFERAIRHHNSEQLLGLQLSARAWYLLGTTLAECDDDASAIAALKTAVSYLRKCQLQNENAHNMLASAHLALAVCHTNELEWNTAFTHILQWLRLRRKHWHERPEMNFDASHETLTASALLEPVQEAAKEHAQDAECHIAEGLLWTILHQYSHAAAAFRRAVSIRKNDARLWNKLGATLANDGRSEEALRAYRTAIDICPSFIRAWVNVGTAYCNRGEFQLAARYYVRALDIATAQQQQSASVTTTLAEDDQCENVAGNRNVNPDVEHVWDYLRTVLMSLQRYDLMKFVNEKNLSECKKQFTT